MMLPRLAAMSEVLWSPKDRRDPQHFFSRIESQLRRYQAAGYTYARSLYSVSMSAVLDTVKRQVLVSLTNESGDTPIRYTLDGSTPNAASLEYTGPFVADRSLEIQAVSVRNGEVAERSDDPSHLRSQGDCPAGHREVSVPQVHRGRRLCADERPPGHEVLRRRELAGI